jgi:negative regulator of replication initiation
MLKTYRKYLLTFITLTRVDSKVFTRTTISMKMRLRLHLPQASDWLTASSELLVVDEVLHPGILL